MNYLKIALGIFVTLSVTRFIPHPPNFTSLMALSFYVPVFFGIRYLPIVLISFAITDLIIGFHSVTLFTWGSVALIGLISRNFVKNISTRILGSLIGACLFFVVTNFGVWSLGSYGYNINGLIECYTLAIPFFTYSLISTLFFSSIFEGIYKFYKIKFQKIHI
ncbi:hypothetical protein OAL68_03315 [Candidatus Pelagibacter sp.]|nr:hypothetical protein [Candidatus Pelagibacter sp.]|tara:strand:- start:250 stop:738 length:489 start_codon:yes stop_codon:yes gene_type:complete